MKSTKLNITEQVGPSLVINILNFQRKFTLSGIIILHGKYFLILKAKFNFTFSIILYKYLFSNAKFNFKCKISRFEVQQRFLIQGPNMMKGLINKHIYCSKKL